MFSARFGDQFETQSIIEYVRNEWRYLPAIVMALRLLMAPDGNTKL